MKVTETIFSFIYVLDMLGIAAFAISGALVAIRNQFDLFGIFLVAFITALGGGIFRDLLLNAHPVNYVADVNNLYVVFIAVVLVFCFRSKIELLSKTVTFFDTIGIGVFTMFSTKKGLDLGYLPSIVIPTVTFTSVTGGILRDVLTNEIPLVFKKELYASACLIGSVVFYILSSIGIPTFIVAIASILTVVTVRVVAIKYQVMLPSFKKDLFELMESKKNEHKKK